MAWSTEYGTSTYTSRIHGAFDSRSYDLQQERWKAEETIGTWASALHFQIDEHAKEQKNLLAYYYNERKRILDVKRNETVNEMLKIYRQQDYNQINNLIEQCKTLKFELLVAFAYESQPISFIQCVTKEHLAQKMKNESSATKSGNYRSDAQLEVKDGRNSEKNIDPHTGLSRNSTSTSGQPTAQSSVASKPTNTFDHSMSGSNRQPSQVMSGDGSDAKCPICFMIFASTLEPRDRTKHVNEHYA